MKVIYVIIKLLFYFSFVYCFAILSNLSNMQETRYFIPGLICIVSHMLTMLIEIKFIEKKFREDDKK